MGEASPAAFDPAVRDYYERAPEETRLQHGPFQLEEARTRELISRFAPPPPATVVDIGGAAGAYALWLAEAGYSVHLLDPVPRLVAEAERRSAAAAQPLTSCRVGDARSVPMGDASADVVLLLGPLYHLIEAGDRALALREVVRVLRPGGWLFAAGVERDLRDGQHRNATDRLDYFTTAFFHRPEDLASEVAEAGLLLNGVYGVEGPGWILPDVADRMGDPARRNSLLLVARMLELEPAVVGSSAHLLAIARRTG
jgi:SAM-dependent methyltransferase